MMLLPKVSERWLRKYQKKRRNDCDPKSVTNLTKWLSRQVRGQRVPRARVAADAAAIVHLGLRARSAVYRKRPPARYFDAAEKILSPYNSEVVRQADPLGMSLGVIFRGSNFRSGFRNIFYVA